MKNRLSQAGFVSGAVLVFALLAIGCTQPPPQICAPPAGYGGGVLQIDDDARDVMLTRADSVASANDYVPATMKRTVTENDLTLEVSYSSGETLASRGLVVELCKPSGEVLSVRFLQ